MYLVLRDSKRLVAHSQRLQRQVSASRPCPQRPPSERVLQRCLYFLNPEHSKYVCIGFYPDWCHRAFFELGSARQQPVVLPSSLVPTLALHLPKLCVHLTGGEPYMYNEMFRIQTVAEIDTRISIYPTSHTPNLPEIEYLRRRNLR
jgi:hypothetical protein